MLRSILIGLVAGSRAITPLAAVSDAGRRGALRKDAPVWLGRPWVAAGLTALAAGELGGDKLHSAPNRTAPAGMLARVASGALAGAAVAPRHRAAAGALLGAAAAVAGAYATFALRGRAMRRWGQAPAGLVEDALAVGAARRIVGFHSGRG